MVRAVAAAEKRRAMTNALCCARVCRGGSGRRLQGCGLRRLHFPRISTHLLRPLHVDKRGRQPFDFHKLHARSTAEAENNALVVLLKRDATGLRVDGDAIRGVGPSAYHGLHGGCSVHSAVHFNCSGSSVTHAVARAQMLSFGGMLSFEAAGGRDAALRVAGRVQLFKRATSLGGYESLIEHRASVEGPASTAPAGLLRCSIGLEHPDDLIADLREALL